MRNLVLSIVAILSLSTQVFAGTPFTLKAAVAEAMSGNPNLKSVNEKLTELDAQVGVARVPNLPTFSGEIDSFETKDASTLSAPKFGADPYNQLTASLKLRQRIFQIGSFARVDASEKDLRVGKMNTDITKRDLVRSVIQAYFQLVNRTTTLKIIQEQEKIARESVSATGKRVKTGRAQTIDSLQAQTQLQLLQGQLTSAQNAQKVAAANLNRILGSTHEESFELPGNYEIRDFTKIKEELKSRSETVPELLKQDLLITKVDDLRRAVRGENLPTIGLIGSYDYNAYSAAELVNQRANSWTLGVQLVIPIYTGNTSVVQERALVSQRTQAELNKVSIQNEMSYQASASGKNLDSAEESIESAQEALKLAIQSSKEASRLYGFATIDFLQYLTIQQALAQAKISLASYEYDYIVAVTDLFVATGRPMDRLVEIIENSLK